MLRTGDVVDQMLDREYFIVCDYTEDDLTELITVAMKLRVELRNKRIVAVYPKPNERVWEFNGRAYLGKRNRNGGRLIADDINNVVEHHVTDRDGIQCDVMYDHGFWRALKARASA